MKVKTVSYRRTVNLGNYASATFEATAEVGESTEEEAAESIMRYVVEQLEIEHGKLLAQRSGSE